MKTYKHIAVILAAAVIVSGGGVSASLLTAPPALAASTQAEIDTAVTQILNDTNSARKAAGLAPVVLSSGVSKVAQSWTEKMASENNFRHNSSYATQMPRTTEGASENIALGYPAGDVVDEGWMKSTTGHRENILNPKWTHIGIGYWVDDNGTTWFTQNFGSYNLNLSTPYAANNSPKTNELTTSWYGKNESITDYKVDLYSPTGNLIESKIATFSPADFRPYLRVTFTGLEAMTTYTVKTTARNSTVMDNTVESPVRTETITTLEEVPAPKADEPPSLAKISSIFHNRLSLSWGAPPDVVGTVTGYMVTVREEGKEDRIFETTETKLDVTELAENTDYIIEIAASVLGADQTTRIFSTSAALYAKTPVYNPVAVNAPTGLIVSSTTHDAATIAWKAPTGTVGKILNYTIKVNSAAGQKVFTTAATSYRLTGLKASTDYTVSVQAEAVSVDGLNRATSMGAATIFGTSAAPSPIVKVAAPTVTVSRVAYNGFTVSWPQPAVTGKITNYRVIVKQGTRVVKTYELNSSTRSQLVTGLAENTNYTVSVVAGAIAPNNVNRTSSVTNKTVKTTLSAASTVRVSPPASFATSTTRNAVTATWRKPAVTGRVVNYTVTLKQGSRVIKTAVITGGRYTFSGLKSNTLYSVSVKANAVSANGKYKASNAVSKLVRTR